MKQKTKLPEGWQEVELVSICDIRKGSSITKDKVTEGEIPVIAGGQEPAYYHNKYNREGETITVSASGAYAGFVNYFEKPIFASDCSTIQVKDKKNVLIRYVYYFLKKNQKRIYKFQKGGGQPHVYPKDLAQLNIIIPPIAHQKRILHLIEKANRAKHNRLKSNEITKDYLRSVFLQMFGDLNKNPYKFPLATLSEVTEVNPKKSELGENYNKKVSFMSMADIGEQGEIYHIETKEFNEVCKGFTYFKKDDVLFAKITPCMENGKGAIAKIPTEAGFGSTEFHILRSIKQKTVPEWIYYLLSLKQIRDKAEQNMTGSAGQKRVPTAFFDVLKVPLPPIELQQKFSKIVEQVEKLKEKQQKSKEKIDEIFDSLMQKAFRGELIK